MFAPRFSIRTLLILITGGAFIFLITGLAVRGQHWAWGFTITALSVGFVLFANALWFGMVSLAATILDKRRLDSKTVLEAPSLAQSAAALHSPPPQDAS
jgi:hypothetical protein